jgi:hypothetical protein
MAIFLNNAPFTEEGAKLQLTAEMEETCKVVYKLDDKGGAVFAELWNPEAEYTDEYVVMPIKSTFKEVGDEYPAGTTFANVEGSSQDPNHECPWIRLINQQIGGEHDCLSCCAEDGIIYNYDDEEIAIDACNGWFDENHGQYGKFKCLVGGHTMPPVDGVLPKETGELPAGSDVYLFPICNRHNTHGIGYGTGAGYYMKLRHNMKAIILEGYLQTPQLQALLYEAKINT